MRAVTLWQPWASLLMSGRKRFETRGWRLREPGWVAIHAAKREPSQVREDVASGQDSLLFAYALSEMGVTFGELPRGVVLGLAWFGEALRTEAVAPGLEPRELAFGDWGDGRWAWPVERVVRFGKPVAARGRQAVWAWDAPFVWVRLLGDVWTIAWTD